MPHTLTLQAREGLEDCPENSMLPSAPQEVVARSEIGGLWRPIHVCSSKCEIVQINYSILESFQFCYHSEPPFPLTPYFLLAESFILGLCHLCAAKGTHFESVVM
ncbi:hypothetical protein AVEN_66418-1 [Araneus ventricosus]|uniref:Uncharacterized protein n=1 Tax=Araneus ventricosus TaxID=182803 RepID=A0A4Y2EMF1_ARAVE|nr:hypothetical protein AVEN_66418-1 [Araneus ventricosus]